ncbi:MAG TPA: BadF/BadG/BcrA/BcrD ATPase family protein [Longimicrobiaceae bacterium]|nr:BadF/BadG/BcrA/BcrD ATPase family protein [Longimicrobiaceae bacterium]
MTPRFLAGVDGGGTKTLVALADESGRELARRTGPAGLVDPRHPEVAAQTVASVVREAMRGAGLDAPLEVLCAGLAGVGNLAEREAVRQALLASGVAARVEVVTDGQTALEGALGGGAGILLISGTGSVAYGRGEDGRVERSGGWGMVVGDEGSGFAIGRAGLVAALRSVDGRGPETRLLPLFLELLGVEDVHGIPPWAGRSAKAEIAALATHVIRAAGDGDAVALRLVDDEARALAEHAAALRCRLDPWSGAVPVVFHGGVLGTALFSGLVEQALAGADPSLRVAPPVADAVAGALRFARALLAPA